MLRPDTKPALSAHRPVVPFPAAAVNTARGGRGGMTWPG